MEEFCLLIKLPGITINR